MIASTCALATDPNIETLLDDETYSELVVQMLEYLIVTLNHNSFSQSYYTHMEKLIVQVCFNLLKFTHSEA